MKRFYKFYLFCAIFFLIFAGFAAAGEADDDPVADDAADAVEYPSVWATVGTPQPPVRTVIPPLPPAFTDSPSVQPEATNAAITIKIVPRMPDPQSSRTYRLQVGAFSNTDLAWRSYDRLKNAGLNPSFELHNTIYRVVVPGVQAANVPDAVRRIESAGYTEVWIREEN